MEHLAEKRAKAQKRRRQFMIGGGVAVVLVIIVIVLSLSNQTQKMPELQFGISTPRATIGVGNIFPDGTLVLNQDVLFSRAPAEGIFPAEVFPLVREPGQILIGTSRTFLYPGNNMDNTIFFKYTFTGVEVGEIVYGYGKFFKTDHEWEYYFPLAEVIGLDGAMLQVNWLSSGNPTSWWDTPLFVTPVPTEAQPALPHEIKEYESTGYVENGQFPQPASTQLPSYIGPGG